ncbi:hypothetical protein KO491_13550 [Roseovarius nubinhibens]|uniref:tetratricopeptide repeat protein n=1 Tax=Roseovarius nubinhibens TaxID=314263 RepID=UPI001C0969CA|nr:hypothetical protein [Roseovarius nubinhibens]MBU3000864.1 hypothetical protein [Roseovarius nubinhibens]
MERNQEFKRAVADRVRDYLARERISREQFAFRTKLGKSTIDKFLVGLYSDKTLSTVAQETGLDLSGAIHFPALAPQGDAFDVSPPPVFDGPSIAVLPFENRGASEYFVDGIVEDVITALAQVPRLFVVARTSSFSYRGLHRDVRQIGQELGVRYVLEGSVQSEQGRVRVTGQLINATTGGHLWADRFNYPLDDIFKLQDTITECVVGAIAPMMLEQEIARQRSNWPTNVSVYDQYLQALALIRRVTREDNFEGLKIIDDILRAEPHYAVASGLGAWGYALRIAQFWSDDPEEDRARGTAMARAALVDGQSDAEALSRGGYSLAWLACEFETGLAAIERSIQLNPNDAVALSHAGWVKCYLGRGAEALQDFERCLRICPLETTRFRIYAGKAFAHFMLDEFDQCLACGEQALNLNPSFTPSYRILCAVLAAQNRLDEARAIADRLLALVPGFNLSIERAIFRNSGRLDDLLRPMMQAGLPYGD